MLTDEIRAFDGKTLQLRIWQPASEPRAVVQIAHGAAEHLGRYERLAAELTAAGYAVIGADHRGHGANAELHGFRNLGPGGFQGVVDDMRAIADHAQVTWPARPLVLLGHSFGSFAAQLYFVQHPATLDGLVLSGTSAIELLLEIPDFSASLEACNAAFEPARTPFDWLSRDEAEVDAYLADPQCGTDISAESIATMAPALDDIRCHPGLATAVERQIPIYILSGEFDAVGGPDQCLATAVADNYRASGLGDVTQKIYPGGRHEMFNELNRAEVTTDLIRWLDARFT